MGKVTGPKNRRGCTHKIMTIGNVEDHQSYKHNEDSMPDLARIGMRRREFLALGALGSLTGLLAACQDGSLVSASPTLGTTPSSTSSPVPTRQPSPTRIPSPTSSDWSTLAASL